jgi:hypothetical protein
MVFGSYAQWNIPILSLRALCQFQVAFARGAGFGRETVSLDTI